MLSLFPTLPQLVTIKPLTIRKCKGPSWARLGFLETKQARLGQLQTKRGQIGTVVQRNGATLRLPQIKQGQTDRLETRWKISSGSNSG